jgi:hypothetical protein
MNRKILFRGKRLDNGKWVFGDLLTKHLHHEGLAIVENGVLYREVDPKTVGQYTRIKIGGQKLFEHDIVRYRETGSDDWQYGIVVWCGDRDYPAFDVEPWIDCDCNGLSYIKMDCEVEIVGNKWDNPELLEVPEMIKQDALNTGRVIMKGKLRKGFIERMEAVLYEDIVIEEVEDLIHDFCDQIQNRLLTIYYELRRIEGLTEIDAIRNTLEKLVKDLW